MSSGRQYTCALVTCLSPFPSISLGVLVVGAVLASYYTVKRLGNMHFEMELTSWYAAARPSGASLCTLS
jgi:hypothetical protein